MILDDVPILHDYKLNHLLYADALLLLSASCAGLQNNINRVFDFFNKCGFKINSDKSKVMVFSKGGKKVKDRFKFVIKDTEVEAVSHYKYLGINISNTGNFREAEKIVSL